jgi:hypothetical protein
LKRRTKSAAIIVALLTITLAQPASASNLSMVIPNSDLGEVNALLDGTTRDSAVALSVPFSNKVTNENAVEITLSDLSVGEQVSAIATNALLVTKTHTAQAPVSANDGSSTLYLKSIGGGPVTIYAYTTRSEIGSVTITVGSSIFTRYLIGIPGPAYNISLEAPSYLDPKGSGPLTLTVTDVFGNQLNQLHHFNPQNDLKVVTLGASTTAFVYSPASKAYTSSITPKITNGGILLSVGIDAEAVPDFSEPRSLEVRSISVENLAETVANLKRELGLLKAHERTARKAHNQLARKWNAAGGKKVKMLKKRR